MSSPPVPLVRAIAWIVASALVVAAAGHFFASQMVKRKKAMLEDSRFRITRIVQTGPQKEALSTLCLAEIMGLSSDRPLSIATFQKQRAEKRLLSCPVIEKARVKTEPPNTIYVEYSARQPVAWLFDYVNMGVDEKGCPFPVTPFFTPKNLPEIYLGAPHKPIVWNVPLKDDRLELAFSVLRLFSTKDYNNLFTLKRIDVSSVDAPSCGQRQLILGIEETCRKKVGGQDILLSQPLFLRLSVKNIGQELGNYLSLRKKIWDTLDTSQIRASSQETVLLPVRVIDLRIEGLAFIR